MGCQDRRSCIVSELNWLKNIDEEEKIIKLRTFDALQEKTYIRGLNY